MNKIRESEVEVLELIEDFLWEQYESAKRSKLTGKQVMTSFDGGHVEVPLSEEFMKNIDSSIEKVHSRYLTLLQLVEKIGFDSYELTNESNESVRCHKILPHSEFKKLKVM